MALTLEVWPEPKVIANDLTSLKVKPTIDDKQQPVVPILADPNLDRSPDPQVVINGNPVNIRLALPNRDAFDGNPTGTSVRQIPLRLKLPESPGKTLPMLQGAVAGQVLTPVQPLIRVTDPAQALGKTFAGKDGSELRVQEITNRGNGEVLMTVELQSNMAANPNAMALMQAIQINNRRGFAGMRSSTLGLGQQQLVLYDAEGVAFQPGTLTQSQTNIVNGTLTMRQTLTFRSANPKAEPKQLVYQASRLAVVEIPFVLREIVVASE
jgi:hypothetical protein